MRRWLRWPPRPPEVDRLVYRMAHGPNPEAARETLDRLWVEGAPHRDRIWEEIWTSGLSPSPEVIRFLLEPDPECPYQPRVRLVAGLSIRTHAHPSPAWQIEDQVRTRGQAATEFAGVLALTDHPDLLAVLEAAFVDGLWFTTSWSIDLNPDPPLWMDGSPTPLLECVLANPHLPTPGRGPSWKPGKAVLMIVRDRADLLAELDEVELANDLIKVIPVLPAEPAAACARVLRSLGSGEARAAVRAMALVGDYGATVAAYDGGYFYSTDPVALLLALVEDWDRYDAADPDGSVLRGYDSRSVAAVVPDLYPRLEWLTEGRHVPRRVRKACRALLRALPQPPKPTRNGVSPEARRGGYGITGSGGYSSGGGSVH